jgi:hypothetical protein
MRPVGDPWHQIVFYRIKVNIVDAPLEIAIISNCVFPESTLPKLIFAARVACYGCAGIQANLPCVLQVKLAQQFGVRTVRMGPVKARGMPNTRATSNPSLPPHSTLKGAVEGP